MTQDKRCDQCKFWQADPTGAGQDIGICERPEPLRNPDAEQRGETVPLAEYQMFMEDGDGWMRCMLYTRAGFYCAVHEQLEIVYFPTPMEDPSNPGKRTL